MPHKRPKEDHGSFLSRFTLKLPPTDLERLDFAYDLSKYSHRNQFRENGDRYFEHLRASALILIDELGVMDVDLVIATLLHDSVEDSFLLSPTRIRMIFGDRVAQITETVSKPPKTDRRFGSHDERLLHYLDTVKHGSIDAKLVKLCDRLHNLRTLEVCSTGKQQRKLEETRVHYLPLIKDIQSTYLSVGNQLENLFQEALEALSA